PAPANDAPEADVTTDACDCRPYSQRGPGGGTPAHTGAPVTGAITTAPFYLRCHGRGCRAFDDRLSAGDAVGADRDFGEHRAVAARDDLPRGLSEDPQLVVVFKERVVVLAGDAHDLVTREQERTGRVHENLYARRPLHPRVELGRTAETGRVAVGVGVLPVVYPLCTDVTRGKVALEVRVSDREEIDAVALRQVGPQ